MRKWAIWIPVLMVASLLYWTVALGLGGLSLMVVSSFDCDMDGRGETAGADGLSAQDLPGLRGLQGLGLQGLKDSYEPITVNLVESPEASEVQDSAVSPAPETADQGPGATAF